MTFYIAMVIICSPVTKECTNFADHLPPYRTFGECVTAIPAVWRARAVEIKAAPGLIEGQSGCVIVRGWMG